MALAAAIGLSLLPRGISNWLRSAWREAIYPAQRSVANASQLAANGWRQLWPVPQSASEEAQRTIVELSDRLKQLETELLVARSAGEQSPSGTIVSTASDLVLPEFVSARVIGRQAAAFLNERDLLDAGRSRGVAADALVIDQGRDSALEPARLVLASGRIWGKVADVGVHTSTVRRITDNGFRELAQIASRRDGRLQFGTRGMLVGIGKTYCMLEQIRTSETVAVGDLVFTTDDSLLETPLVYGTVAKIERPPPGAYWEIFVEPAVNAAMPPAKVAVLKFEINPARVAGVADLKP
jgi:cell shape-determining protein MreC